MFQYHGCLLLTAAYGSYDTILVNTLKLAIITNFEVKIKEEYK